MNRTRKPHPLRDRSGELRDQMTVSELVLWQALRRRGVSGFRFRRQVPIGRYIVDFVCLEEKLIVEVDGSDHKEKLVEDAERTKWMESQGFRVLRFWNHEVESEIDGVIEGIWNVLQRAQHSPPPRPSPRKGGGGRADSGCVGRS